MIIGIVSIIVAVSGVVATIVIAKRQYKERIGDKTDTKNLLNEQIDIDAKMFIR